MLCGFFNAIIFTMRKLFVFAFIAFLTLSASAQDATTFILVRHAEKASDGTNDPGLSQPGLERANELAALLVKQSIHALYSTPYKRTKATLTPIARDKNLEINSYDPYDGKKLLADVLGKYAGGTVVISGHSNTIPGLANELLGKEVFSQFEESDYSNLILIVADEMGKGKLIHLNF